MKKKTIGSNFLKHRCIILNIITKLSMMFRMMFYKIQN